MVGATKAFDAVIVVVGLWWSCVGELRPMGAMGRL